MNRAEKFKKLENAVKEYRGVFHPVSKKWIRPPDISKRASIYRWLGELGCDVGISVLKIDGFKTFSEMPTWISGL